MDYTATKILFMYSFLMFSGLPDPDPVIRDADPDPDPSLSHKCVERTEIMPAE